MHIHVDKKKQKTWLLWHVSSRSTYLFFLLVLTASPNPPQQITWHASAGASSQGHKMFNRHGKTVAFTRTLRLWLRRISVNYWSRLLHELWKYPHAQTWSISSDGVLRWDLLLYVFITATITNLSINDWLHDTGNFWSSTAKLQLLLCEIYHVLRQLWHNKSNVVASRCVNIALFAARTWLV